MGGYVVVMQYRNGAKSKVAFKGTIFESSREAAERADFLQAENANNGIDVVVMPQHVLDFIEIQ